jgi:hypothetical protein
LLASVPDLQNVHVLLNLAQGRWLPPGGDPGNEVPLRFFTWDSWKELLIGAGLRLRSTQALHERGNVWQQGPLTLTGLSREEMTRLCTQQFLVLAQKETPETGRQS